MGKKTTSLLAATTFALAAMLSAVTGCEDGPVEKRLDCLTICNEAEDCVGENFDKAECKEQCNEEADADAVDNCQQCLNDQDSCSEDLKCSVECTGVLADIVFK